MIYADPNKCSGCGRCEMACSFGRTKSYSRSASLVKLAREENLGLDFPVTCVQCYRCVAACQAEALSITDKGLIRLDREKCHPRTWARVQGVRLSEAVPCGACEEVCPVGVLEIDEHPAFCTAAAVSKRATRMPFSMLTSPICRSCLPSGMLRS